MRRGADAQSAHLRPKGKRNAQNTFAFDGGDDAGRLR